MASDQSPIFSPTSTSSNRSSYPVQRRLRHSTPMPVRVIYPRRNCHWLLRLFLPLFNPSTIELSGKLAPTTRSESWPCQLWNSSVSRCNTLTQPILCGFSRSVRPSNVMYAILSGRMRSPGDLIGCAFRSCVVCTPPRPSRGATCLT